MGQQPQFKWIKISPSYVTLQFIRYSCLATGFHEGHLVKCWTKHHLAPLFDSTRCEYQYINKHHYIICHKHPAYANFLGPVSTPMLPKKAPTNNCLRYPKRKDPKSLQLTQLVPKKAKFRLLMYLFQAGFEASHRRCNLKKRCPILGLMTCFHALLVDCFDFVWLFVFLSLSSEHQSVPHMRAHWPTPKLFVLYRCAVFSGDPKSRKKHVQIGKQMDRSVGLLFMKEIPRCFYGSQEGSCWVPHLGHLETWVPTSSISPKIYGSQDYKPLRWSPTHAKSHA